MSTPTPQPPLGAALIPPSTYESEGDVVTDHKAVFVDDVAGDPVPAAFWVQAHKDRDHDGDHGCPCGTSERVMTPRPSAEDVIAAAFRAGPGEERPGDGTPGDVARLVLRALAGAGLTVVREPSQASTVVDAQPAASLVESSAPETPVGP